MAKEGAVSVTIAEGGRIVIPASYRRALGVRPGDEIVLRLEESEVRITSRSNARLRAQEYVRAMKRKGRSMLKQLIRERRAADD
ncbi:MAG TPA: AbrB/MazE/SpoVT family DNA-binding domain-containing protein [Bryobacteraceae bacterium]|nr:AbrB/MazE/SpoVT family DNA-binding domain-containing protein [Bryobacteraceae bacterium]